MTSFKILEENQIEIIVNMMQEFYAIDNYPIDGEVTNELFKEFIQNENLGQSWLIYDNETIVGYAIITYIFSFEYKGKMAFFEELYIKDAFRGQGIGHEAIKFVKDFAKAQNVKMMYLEVESHNKKAQKLYLANDFVIHNRMIMKLPFQY
jgi:GNAT superfamily N-acetyltransferase